MHDDDESGELDRETIDEVLRLLSKRCRHEVEAALDQRTELSINCKQDIQTVLGGYDQKGPYDPVPDLPEEGGILKHQTAISISAVAVALVVLVFRLVWRQRTAAAAESARKKNTKKKASKQVKNKTK